MIWRLGDAVGEMATGVLEWCVWRGGGGGFGVNRCLSDATDYL